MLWNVSGINGYAIAAGDGHVGSVVDLLFDDASWRIGWLVVDSGDWLPRHPADDATTTIERDDEAQFYKYYGEAMPGDHLNPNAGPHDAV